MDNKALISTDVRDYEHGYGLAYKLASEQLAGTDDIEQLCLRSGAEYRVIGSKKVITVKYLNRPYTITLPDMMIKPEDSDEAVPLRDKILLLHYLTQAKGTPPSHKMIAFKELPAGANYFRTFSKRTIKPLIEHFGREPHQLLAVADTLGGRKADYGDVAVTIAAFNRVAITLVLWRGDEEFPPEGNIMFDNTISDYLTTEDIIVLCEILAWRLVRQLRAGGDNHNRD